MDGEQFTASVGIPSEHAEGVRREYDFRVLMSLVASAKHEVFSLLPGGTYSPNVMRSSWDDDIALVRRGVECRAIYQADSTRTPEMLRYLGDFVREGGKVRVARRITHRAVIIDRAVAWIATQPDTFDLPCLVVTEGALVGNLRQQFVGVWKDSLSVGFSADDQLEESLVRQTLEILKTGVTDEVAAKQLGLSARTVRRRVAAVMDLLGASSRFEAGVKAAQSGWL